MKTYNCPYCKGVKLTRDKLVKHIDRKHDDELPDGFTAYRLVYDIVNDHPDHIGHCTICNNPTKWNEKRQKYERLCGNPKCYDEVKKIYQKRMIKVYNKTSLMDDPEHLEKMLAGRKISGKYKWSDGREFTYTGSYEKNFLEFLDKTMEFDSKDIICPGPVLEYNFRGKKLKWITDFYLPIYNLIIEVKFGVGVGSYKPNPNNRSMPEYNAKTIAKEVMITNLGKYNYLRLTNNDFAEFMSLLAELKMNMKDNKQELLYRIHESFCVETFDRDNAKNIYYKEIKEFEEQEEKIRNAIRQDIIPNSPSIIDFIHTNYFIIERDDFAEDLQNKMLYIIYEIKPNILMSNLDFLEKIHRIYDKLIERLKKLSNNKFIIGAKRKEISDNVDKGLQIFIMKNDSKKDI